MCVLSVRSAGVEKFISLINVPVLTVCFALLRCDTLNATCRRWTMGLGLFMGRLMRKDLIWSSILWAVFGFELLLMAMSIGIRACIAALVVMMVFCVSTYECRLLVMTVRAVLPTALLSACWMAPSLLSCRLMAAKCCRRLTRVCSGSRLGG